MKSLNLSPEADWRKRFKLPVVAGTSLAGRNHARGMAVTNQSGVYQLHAWDMATGDLRQLTYAPAGVVIGGISPDGQYIYYLNDASGNEIGHYVRVPFKGGDAEDITPDMPLYSSFSIGQSLNGARIGFSTAGQDGFYLWTMPVATGNTLGSPVLLYHSKRLSSGPTLSADARYAVIATTERATNLNTCLYAFNVSQSEVIQHVLQDADASIKPSSFSPVEGDSRLLAQTNVTGFSRPLIWDVATGERTDLPLLEMDGDIFSIDWSPKADKILLLQIVSAQMRFYVYDLERSAMHRLDHPTGMISASYFYNDDEIWANLSDSTRPSRVVAFDTQTGHLLREVLSAGEVPTSQPLRSVEFPSTHSATIQAWVGTPEGTGPWPMILHTHGGPTAAMFDSFSPSLQTWIDHGFAIMSVNYRGSTTFGRTFEQAIWGNLGELEVDDMAAGYKWAVDNGIAIADSVLLTGGSYGGYLTLQALGVRPELWAGGMADVAIADWALMYEDQAETLRGYQVSLFGGTPVDTAEQTAKSSPITYAEAIRAPVLVIQGANDTRCPARQMHVYEDKLKSLGKDITIEWFDAGHGSRALDEQIGHMEKRLRWAYRVLG